jgi:hypothetical protein
VKGLIREMSILSPSRQPAEPLARVCWVGEKQESSPAARSTSDRASSPATTADESFDDEFVRPLDRLYQQHIAGKRTKPQMLVRHGVVRCSECGDDRAFFKQSGWTLTEAIHMMSAVSPTADVVSCSSP